MPLSVRLLQDSVNPAGIRLSTFELSVHRYIWPEFLTHRALSRNAQSNRAIPTAKLLEQVRNDPALPLHWGKNQAGMQAAEEVDEEGLSVALRVWTDAAQEAVNHADHVMHFGLHKQVANRLLEPFQWIRAIVSATDWDNFLKLRCHPDAQPEIRIPAEMMRDALAAATPEELNWGEWHLPLTADEDWESKTRNLIRIRSYMQMAKISTARCARVSYLNHLGKRDPAKDLELHDRLIESQHLSPTEHVSQAIATSTCRGTNFHPTWVQYRRMIEK